MLLECLVREGVSTVFGYPGGAILPAYDAMLEYPIRHVLSRHEQGAAHMADGYARASGKVGVAVGTSRARGGAWWTCARTPSRRRPTSSGPRPSSCPVFTSRGLPAPPTWPGRPSFS